MQIIMPKLGLTMTQGTITEWLKSPGEAVKAEEALCAYETEKVTLELTAPEDGVLVEILAPAGTTVAAGAAVCEVAATGEAEVKAEVKATSALTTTSTSTSASLATPKARALARERGVDLRQVSGTGPGGRVQAADVTAFHAAAQPAPLKATPLARRIAAAEGVDLRALAGTGPEGMITREDVETAVRERGSGGAGGQRSGGAGEPGGRGAGEPGATDHAPRTTHHAAQITDHGSRITETILPLTALRRTIGERMSASAFTAPHVTLFAEADATNLVSARAQINEELARNVPGTSVTKISYNALLAALVARALKEFPHLNSRLEPDGIHVLPEINIALAVENERGLLTPVLRNVAALSLPAIQRGYDDLTGRALTGKSLPADFEAGTFTITNLGGLDIDGFTPIINPPQAAILGIGRIVEKPVARDGAVVIRPMLVLSLSFDHRIVDGAPAARFLQRIKQLVERPVALLL